MKHQAILPGAALALLVLVTLLAGCNDTLDNNIATLNAAATQAAQGVNVTLPSLPGLEQTAGALFPTGVPNVFDLLANPGETMAHAWWQIYGLPSGSEFSIIATEDQAGQFVIETLQLGGWQETVRGGSVAIGVGQIRLDVALILEDDEFGSGTVTFQPTLDGLGRLRLNPQGGEFGQLQIPNNLTTALGDAIHTLLTGARDDSLSKVTLTQLGLENGTVEIHGRVR